MVGLGPKYLYMVVSWAAKAGTASTLPDTLIEANIPKSRVYKK